MHRTDQAPSQGSTQDQQLTDNKNASTRSSRLVGSGSGERVHARGSNASTLPRIAQRIALSISRRTAHPHPQHSPNARQAETVPRSDRNRTVPRFNGVSVFTRASARNPSAGGGGGNGDYEGNVPPQQRAAARSLLSNWLSLARNKMVKKNATKEQLRMSWYRCQEDTDKECVICLDDIVAGSNVTAVRCVTGVLLPHLLPVAVCQLG